MSWPAAVGFCLQIIIWCLNTWKEVNDDKKKQKTEALQSAVRGVLDRDAGRINDAFQRMRDIR
jgi:hypothetical protein